MSSGEKLPLEKAAGLAKALKSLLEPACEKIEIAGSIRRGKPETADGEIVAIPRWDDGRNALLHLMDTLVDQGQIQKAIVTDKNGKQVQRWGDLYRKVQYQGFPVDVFLTDAESWGYQFALRTGPGDANMLVMTKLKYAKPKPPFSIEKGALWQDDQRLAVRTEEEFFTLLGLPYMEPWQRSEAAYKTHFNAKTHAWGNPRALRPALPQLPLLWNYSAAVLAEYPIPDEFIDATSGKMWANTTLDRSRGLFELVEKGSQEARYQHEFLVGDVQRRVELNRLREMLWKDQEIDVPGFFDIGDLSVTYLMTGSGELQQVPLGSLIPTQERVYRWGVYQKVETLQSTRRLRGGSDCVAFAWKHLKGIQFAGSDDVYLVDGHHRLMAARQLGLETLPVSVMAYPVSYAQACGMVEEVDDDEADYLTLAQVLEEAVMILAATREVAL